MTEVARTGMGPVSRHNAWRHENKLEENSHLCSTHEMLSEVVELLACVDQLDLTNLSGAEAASRHLQFIEFEVKKKAEASKTADGSECFLGRGKKTGGALVCPELTRWVAEKSAKDSMILKEQRKAAEERSLAKK